VYRVHPQLSAKKKEMSKEEKLQIKAARDEQEKDYLFAQIDGRREKVGNFRVEPPGLFRGRGEHPKMGKLKSRIMPEDVIINCGEKDPVPPCPIPGHRWGEVRHEHSLGDSQHTQCDVQRPQCNLICNVLSVIRCSHSAIYSVLSRYRVPRQKASQSKLASVDTIFLKQRQLSHFHIDRDAHITELAPRVEFMELSSLLQSELTRHYLLIQVRHEHSVTWLAGWKDSINTRDWKYVQFGAMSTIKGVSNLKRK